MGADVSRFQISDDHDSFIADEPPPSRPKCSSKMEKLAGYRSGQAPASSSSLGLIARGLPSISCHFIIHSQNERCGHEAVGPSISCRGSLAGFCGASAVCWRYGVVSISSIPGVFVGEPNAPAFDAEPSPAAAAVLVVITSSSGVSLRSF